DWRVARTIFVADDDKVAARYGRDDANSPYRHYFGNMRAKMIRGNRLYVFKSHKEQPDEEITLDFVMDNCVFAGSVNKVVDQILAMREETGDFGELVYAGMDWADPALAKRSMQLMAEEVMPRVNAAIGKGAKTAAEEEKRTVCELEERSQRQGICAKRSVETVTGALCERDALFELDRCRAHTLRLRLGGRNPATFSIQVTRGL